METVASPDDGGGGAKLDAYYGREFLSRVQDRVLVYTVQLMQLPLSHAR